MDHPPDESAAEDPLTELRRAYQRYVISWDPRRDPPRYVAIGRDLRASPWCVITDSIDELRAMLELSE